MFNPDKPFVFGKDFFTQHQKKLLKLANSWLGRKILCIDGNKSEVGDNEIIKIEPNAIHWKTENKNEFKAEFRTHNKYSKRMFHAFKPIWYLFHTWDILIANNFEPEWNLGFDTLTVYPDAHPETTTVDGRAVRNNGGTETFANLRAGAGNSGEPSSANDYTLAIVASTTSNQYQILTRGIFLFATSGLTASANIVSATFSQYINSRSNALSGQSSANSAVVLVASTPASNTDIVAGDYGQLGTTDFGRSVTQVNITDTAYNDITLNASGLANISKTGVSKFGTRYGWDFDNTTTGITWSSGQLQGIQGSYADETGTSKDPKLVVIYSGISASSSPSASESSSPSSSVSLSPSLSPSASPSSSQSPSSSPSSSESLSPSLSPSPSSSVSLSPSASPSSSQSPSSSESLSPSASPSLSPSPSSSASLSPSSSVSQSPSLSESRSISLSPSSSVSRSPSSSESRSPSSSPSSSPSPSSAPIDWYYPTTLTVNTGSIDSGVLSDAYLNDNNFLVLNEVAGIPGFDYVFTFGEETSIPDTGLHLSMRAFYDGTTSHNIKIQQWNYNTSAWTNLTAQTTDFFYSPVEVIYEFVLFDDPNYISAGQMKFRLVHSSAGNPVHMFHIDQINLEYPGSESPSPSRSPSASISPSSSVSLSPSASESRSISLSPSSSISFSPSASISLSPSSSESRSPSVSESRSPSSSQSPSSSVSPSPSLSPSSSESRSPSVSESRSPSVSESSSVSLSPSPSSSESLSPSLSPSLSESRSISASPSSSESLSPSISSSSSISSSISASPSPAIYTDKYDDLVTDYEDCYTEQSSTYTNKYREW